MCSCISRPQARVRPGSTLRAALEWTGRVQARSTIPRHLAAGELPCRQRPESWPGGRSRPRLGPPHTTRCSERSRKRWAAREQYGAPATVEEDGAELREGGDLPKEHRAQTPAAASLHRGGLGTPFRAGAPLPPPHEVPCCAGRPPRRAGRDARRAGPRFHRAPRPPLVPRSYND